MGVVSKEERETRFLMNFHTHNTATMDKFYQFRLNFLHNFHWEQWKTSFRVLYKYRKYEYSSDQQVQFAFDASSAAEQSMTSSRTILTLRLWDKNESGGGTGTSENFRDYSSCIQSFFQLIKFIFFLFCLWGSDTISANPFSSCVYQRKKKENTSNISKRPRVCMKARVSSHKNFSISFKTIYVGNKILSGEKVSFLWCSSDARTWVLLDFHLRFSPR